VRFAQKWDFCVMWVHLSKEEGVIIRVSLNEFSEALQRMIPVDLAANGWWICIPPSRLQKNKQSSEIEIHVNAFEMSLLMGQPRPELFHQVFKKHDWTSATTKVLNQLTIKGEIKIQ
jgi:hypothetical protein